MELTKAIQLFCDNLTVLGKSTDTISNYSYYLTNFNKYLSQEYNRQVYIDEIRSEDLEKYVYNHLGEKRYSTSARHSMITAFKSLYSFCYRKGYCDVNIGKLIKNVRVETNERDYITELEFRKIVKEIVSPTARTVVYTLFYTGLRIRECLNLTLDDVDYINDIITVKEGKGRKDRNIPISDRLKPVMVEYMDNDRCDVGTDNFFSSKSGTMTKQFVNRVLGKAVKTAGIEKTVSCHVLRHSFASNLVDRGVDILKVQKLLGHDSIKTTTVYLHTGLDELQDAVNLL